MSCWYSSVAFSEAGEGTSFGASITRRMDHVVSQHVEASDLDLQSLESLDPAWRGQRHGSELDRILLTYIATAR